MRNRVKILDLGFVLIGVAAVGVFAFEIDIFETERLLTRKQEEIELDELMVLVSAAMLGMLYYIWRRASEHKRENARRIEAEREVMTLALQDPLTNLPNRRRFDDELKRALRTLPAAPEAHAIFLLDLNGFKKINDIHGHPVGDQLLIHVSARLMRAAREGDLVARLGGDEFAVIARNLAGAEGAAYVALRLIDAFAHPFAIGGQLHTIGTAIGVALAPHDGEDGRELLRKADVALYRAKTEKKSTVRFFEPQMDASLHERDELERALREGLEQDAFFVCFQPTVRVVDGAVSGFEALPRWRHPRLGELGPDRFLPAAEEAGLLPALTERLLRKACGAAASWPAPIRLAFNFPSALLADTAIGLRILSVLSITGFPPNRLDLEIDEGALIREADGANILLAGLRRAGVSIVADHFGTGYSNLKNLHRLQLDRIKIDPSFVRAMTDDRKAAVMVKALIGIGQGLDIAVAADGVVTGEQRAALAAQGCQDAQGDLLGGPVDADGALLLVARQEHHRIAG